MVVYQALYGDYQVYVRPLEMFISPVDQKKYPDAVQEYRFEQVFPGQMDKLEKNGNEPAADLMTGKCSPALSGSHVLPSVLILPAGLPGGQHPKNVPAIHVP